MRKARQIILGLGLALLIAGVSVNDGHAANITFTGKIQEIRKATALGINKRETYFLVKLDTQAKAEFRISEEEALKYGLVEGGGPSHVITPKQAKGLGWKVRLTCDNNPKGPINSPVYPVKTLERLED